MLNTIEIREPLLDYRLFELQQRFSDNIYAISRNLYKNLYGNKVIFEEINQIR